MKKQTLILAVLIFIFVLIAGVWAAESRPAEELDLKLRLIPGQKYGMRVNKENKISQTIMGRQQNINHIKAVTMELEVKEVGFDGVASIKVTYRTLKEKTKTGTPGQQFEYDSTDPCTAVGNPLASMYSAMMGQSFTIKVAPKGEIFELKGIDEMFSRMAEKIIIAEDELLSKAPACERVKKQTQKETEEERAKRRIEATNKIYGDRKKRTEAVKEMIKKMPMFGNDQIRNMLSGMIITFPDRPVGIGDSWTAKMILASQSLPIEIDGTYTVKGSKKGVVIVDISSKRDLDDEAVPIGKVRMKIAGSYQGTSEIDEASGWMIRSKANMHFSGETKIAGNKEMPEGMTVPMSIESAIAVEQIN